MGSEIRLPRHTPSGNQSEKELEEGNGAVSQLGMAYIEPSRIKLTQNIEPSMVEDLPEGDSEPSIPAPTPPHDSETELDDNHNPDELPVQLTTDLLHLKGHISHAT